MKTKIFLLVTLFLMSLTLNQSCKKREQPRIRIWPFKVHYIMTNSERDYNNILDNIEKGRKTLDKYVWGSDTLTVNGPAGYTPLMQKASSEWKKAVNNDLMPDTTKLGTDGVIAKKLKAFLDERQDHSASKSWDKIRLAIPKKLYKTYPHFWEWLLTFLKDYYTGTVGGSAEYTNGTRDLQKEKDICHLISASDPDEGWGCSCSALLHYESIFKSYAEGNNKAMSASMSIEDAQAMEAEKRHKSAVAKYGISAAGNVEDYKTKFSEDITTLDKGIYKTQKADEGYYYIEFDVNPDDIPIMGTTLDGD